MLTWIGLRSRYRIKDSTEMDLLCLIQTYLVVFHMH